MRSFPRTMDLPGKSAATLPIESPPLQVINANIVILCKIVNKDRVTRVGLEPTTSGSMAGALPTELSSPMLGVSLFCHFVWVPFRSHIR